MIKDLHLLLLDPARFLYEPDRPTSEDGKSVGLLFREHKLYGREREVTLITDAFCRVSEGRSEAFFINGFSGCGKSRLVDSLSARIDMCEGYVITYKFDEVSNERSLLEIISVFNDLCFLICKKSSPQSLLLTINNLVTEFGNDLSVLAHLLPNVKAFSPQFYATQSNEVQGNNDQVNLQSICFTLQRFMRVVSSSKNPVMLFLDDLQWCDCQALKLIESILCDPFGSSCLFFVGSYRSNEVHPSHEVFRLIRTLKEFDLPVTALRLEGLDPEDINTLVSDALCLFPRICEPLSNIVYQKTKGNVRLFFSYAHKVESKLTSFPTL